MMKNLLKGLAHLVAATAIVVAMVIGLSTNVKAAGSYTITFDGTAWNTGEITAAKAATEGDIITLQNLSGDVRPRYVLLGGEEDGWQTDASFVFIEYSESLVLQAIPSGYKIWDITTNEMYGTKNLRINIQALPTYTVSFDPGDGTGSHTAATGVRGTYILPTATTFEAPAGKVFDGWSEVSGGAKIAGTTITVSANKTLYALWKEGSAPTPDPTPDPTPSSCDTNKKSAKKNVEISPYMIAFLNDIVNKNKAQAVAVEVPQTVVVDKDTCKSEAPDHTVGVSNTNSKVGDLKVHTVSEATQANQKFLADSFAAQQGKRARILVNASVHPRRDLGVDAGKKEALIWANLEKVAQPVYAVCYNQTDKAYYISGVLDNNGVANLNDFILRDATNVTIFVLE